MFGTLKEDMANYVWKLTQVGDSILMQNVGMETYPNRESGDRLLLTSDESKISHVVFDYAANTKVDINDSKMDYRDIFYIRLANQPRHAGKYLHQNGHNRGKDANKDLDMGFWNDTYMARSMKLTVVPVNGIWSLFPKRILLHLSRNSSQS